MRKLRVSRKSYTRKAYTRKDGTRVRASKVGLATFKIRDRGKPGRTPKSERFFNPQVRTGWRKDQPAALRRAKSLKAHKKDMLATARSLQSLANVTIDKETRKAARSDAQYFFRLYAGSRNN